MLRFVFVLGYMDISAFGGVWRRVRIEEPIGTLAPDAEQSLIVLWVQSACGVFVDLRIPSGEHAGNVRLMKSFAGRATYDIATKRLTWHRSIDFRFAGTQDIGTIEFLEKNLIQEDGVDGDNYREIWQRAAESSISECAAVLILSGEEIGYFVISHGFFALSIRRNHTIDTNELMEYFAGAGEDLSEVLLTYTAIVGDTTSWKIKYSLDSKYIDQSLRDCVVILKDKFRGIEWNTIVGSLPDFM